MKKDDTIKVKNHVMVKLPITQLQLKDACNSGLSVAKKVKAVSTDPEINMVLLLGVLSPYQYEYATEENLVSYTWWFMISQGYGPEAGYLSQGYGPEEEYPYPYLSPSNSTLWLCAQVLAIWADRVATSEGR